MRRAARTDGNHAAIVAAFRACGCKVQSLAAVGCGVVDLLVKLRTGALKLVEVKNDSRPPSKQRLTPAQESWHRDWPVEMVKNIDDVIRLAGGLHKERE